MKPIIIGIAGGSASGKTSIARKIQEVFNRSNSIAIIKEDDYYKNQSHMEFAERLKTNYDHPLAFDHDLLLNNLLDLQNRLDIYKPTYDFNNYTRSKNYEIIKAADVIVLEGLFVLENKDVRSMLDIKIFVDTPADIRFIRRLVRDVKKRGRNMESVVDQYISTVRIMHEQFIEPSKKYADLIIPEGGQNEVAIDLLCTKISSILAEKML